MKKSIVLLVLILLLPGIVSATIALNHRKDLNALAFMSGHDLANNSVSNINLTNKTGAPITVYGIYLYGVATISPDLNCQNGIEDQGQNYTQNPFMAGTVIEPIAFTIGQSIAIGQNYLYNMIYNWIYWRKSIGGDAGCLLPGCSWSTDTNQINWCFQVGTISPNSSYTSTSYPSNVVPFSWITSWPINNLQYQYNYDLIPNTVDYVWIGPFTCDDKTLTCVTQTPQYQPFQAA